MAAENSKLSKDLHILEAMANEMDAYLKSETAVWPLGGSLPKLTLGGYLLRQHRLLALADQLSPAQWQLLETAVAQFNAALADKVVRTETLAHDELERRLRQWSSYLSESRQSQRAVNYETAVENRAIIQALIGFLQQAPYQLDQRITQQLKVWDNGLGQQWQKGPFVWEESWQAAYPAGEYWWLYGRGR